MIFDLLDMLFFATLAAICFLVALYIFRAFFILMVLVFAIIKPILRMMGLFKDKEHDKPRLRIPEQYAPLVGPLLVIVYLALVYGFIYFF